MAFIPYLIKRFDFTHENDYYRDFALKLQSIYEGKAGLHILIGNIGCQGHQIDAIFIRSGQILIIDFKDYSGNLEFSETNPWKIKQNDGSLLFVAGGAQCRNPFQQVNAYRFALLNFLNDSSHIIASNRTNIRWDHINAMVLFQRDVQFDKNQIPAKIRRYFTIADPSSVFNQIEDRNSPDLLLNDTEIGSILKLLDVREENIFIPNINPVATLTQGRVIPAQRFEQLRRFIKGSNEESQIKRVLNYYRAIIDIERYKTPTVDELFPYTVNWNQGMEEITISPVTHPRFADIFLKNREEQFPRNLFIGINISIEGETRTLFHTIILNSDINVPQEVKFNINALDLYTETLESLGLQEDTIDELTTAVNEVNTLTEKLSCVREILGVVAELTETISLGLSTASLFTSQMLSELKKLVELNEADYERGIIKPFLLNKEIISTQPEQKFEPFIQVTKLNSSQEKAVRLSFSQPLTVITGPPGTGKSDVVLTIIANAIANNKSVLFASKNNRAVDCVMERFQKVSADKSFIRFGSRSEIETNSRQVIGDLINNIRAGNFNVDEANLYDLRKKLIDKSNRLIEIQKTLDSIIIIEKTLKDQKLNLENLLIEKKRWRDSLDPEILKIFIDDNLEMNVDLNDLNQLITRVKKFNSGFINRIIFNLFSKANVLRAIAKLNRSFPEPVQYHINIHSPYIDPSVELLNSLYQNCTYISGLCKETSSVKKENKKKEEDIIDLANKIETNTRELGRIISTIPEYEEEALNIKESMPKDGIAYLETLIKYRLSNASIPSLQAFKEFIPMKLWNSNDLAQFRVACENFISDFKAVSVTSLSVKNSFSLSPGLFDVLVIDEASQCDVASALPLLFRAKSAVIIGDPLQLKHISSIQGYEEDFVSNEFGLHSLNLSYSKKSLFDLADAIANKSNLQSIFLDEHYRCHPMIATYSNDHFYRPRIGQELKIKTKHEDFKYSPQGLTWINVVGQVNDNQNVNLAEVNRVIQIAREKAQEYPNASIGIATPFKAQYQAIFNQMGPDLRTRVKVATVHSFQGDEKDIMIFSLVVSDGSRDSLSNFINIGAPYLLNVAVTRAKSSLIVVGNHTYCLNLRNGQAKTLLCKLAEYASALEAIIA